MKKLLAGALLMVLAGFTCQLFADENEDLRKENAKLKLDVDELTKKVKNRDEILEEAEFFIDNCNKKIRAKDLQIEGLNGVIAGHEKVFEKLIILGSGEQGLLNLILKEKFVYDRDRYLAKVFSEEFLKIQLALNEKLKLKKKQIFLENNYTSQVKIEVEGIPHYENLKFPNADKEIRTDIFITYKSKRIKISDTKNSDHSETHDSFREGTLILGTDKQDKQYIRID